MDIANTYKYIDGEVIFEDLVYIHSSLEFISWLLLLFAVLIISLETIGGVSSNELDEVLHFTTAIVGDGILFVVLWKPVESGESKEFYEYKLTL